MARTDPLDELRVWIKLFQDLAYRLEACVDRAEQQRDQPPVDGQQRFREETPF